MEKRNEYIKGLFLLLIAILGNYNGELLNCRVQKIINGSLYMKHFVTFLLLFFAIDFSKDELEYPIKTLKKSLIIYILFLFSSRLNIYISGIFFLLLVVIYVIENFINYYTKVEKRDTTQLENVKLSLLNIEGMLIIVGFLLYLYKQYREKKKWDTMKFIFGTLKCDHMLD